MLVLSLFPGIGLLDMAFEEEGFCVVRGPDLLWGGDVRRFSPPPARFDGVIGGPPCKGESLLARLNGTPGASMRSEFYRVVTEAAPSWWVMEGVKDGGDAPFILKLNNRWLGEEQSRKRFFHSNINLAPYVECAPLEAARYSYAVRAANRAGAKGTTKNKMGSYSLDEMRRLQGLDPSFDLPGMTVRGKEEAIGNGVPLPMGRAIARAVRQALGRK